MSDTIAEQKKKGLISTPNIFKIATVQKQHGGIINQLQPLRMRRRSTEWFARTSESVTRVQKALSSSCNGCGGEENLVQFSLSL